MKYKVCNIKGFEKLYLIYENGCIYSMRKKRFLKPSSNGLVYRYMYVCLTGNNGENLRTGVHRIVAHHWISPEPERKHGRYEINHIDHNTENNHYANLEWVLHRENILKAREHHGAWQSGRKPGYKASEHAKRRMSIAHKKVTTLEGHGITVVLESIADAAEYMKVCRRTIERRANTNTTLMGFKISY